MMRVFLWCCVVLVAGSFLAYEILQGSGYVLLVWGDTSIEMSLWFTLALIIVVVFSAWFIYGLISHSYRGIVSVKQKISGHSADKAQQQTVLGLVDFIEGDWSNARKKLTRSAKKVSSPIINYLAAARSAYEMGDEQEALQLLHQAENSAENSHLAVALTQARMQLANKQFEQALATLERAAKISPQHNVLLSLLQQVYVELKDWDSLRKLLPKLQQKKIGTIEERYLLEKRLYKALLLTIQDKNITLPLEEQKKERAKVLNGSWKTTPHHLQRDEEIVSVYAGQLIACGQHDTAELTLAKNIREQWSDKLVKLYGTIQTDYKENMLKRAESWLKTQLQNPVLLLTLGRLCLQNKQWGRAKDFLKESAAIAPTTETYAELARLYHFLGEDNNSQLASQQGLLLVSGELLVVDDFNEGDEKV